MGIGVGTAGNETRSLVGIRRLESTVGQRELELGIEESADRGTTDLRRSQGLNVNDLDGGGEGVVATSHVIVELSNSAAAGDITELFVHVVHTLARGITDPEAVVLDGCGSLVDLMDGQDLTAGSLELVQLAHEVPESGTSHDGVGGEQAHAEHRGVGSRLGGLGAADHNIFVILFVICH